MFCEIRTALDVFIKLTTIQNIFILLGALVLSETFLGQV